MASYTGSAIAVAVALLVVALLVLLLLRFFLPLRSTPAFLLTPVFLSLFLPASIVLLVPIDLASSTSDVDDAHRGVVLPQSAILVAWKISYWLTFALTWFVLRPRYWPSLIRPGLSFPYSVNTSTLATACLETALSTLSSPTPAIT